MIGFINDKRALGPEFRREISCAIVDFLRVLLNYQLQ